MTHPSPNEFQSILTHPRGARLRQKELERRAVERYVGHFIVTWSFVDFELTLAVAHLAGERQKKWAAKTPADKIKKLSELLPEHWTDGAALIALLERGNDLRNALAHSNLAMGGWDGERSLEWHFVDLAKELRLRIELDEGVMAQHSLDADIAREAVSAVMGERADSARAGDDPGFKIAPLIKASPGQWDDDAHFRSYMARVDELFPS